MGCAPSLHSHLHLMRFCSYSGELLSCSDHKQLKCFTAAVWKVSHVQFHPDVCYWPCWVSGLWQSTASFQLCKDPVLWGLYRARSPSGNHSTETLSTLSSQRGKWGPSLCLHLQLGFLTSAPWVSPGLLLYPLCSLCLLWWRGSRRHKPQLPCASRAHLLLPRNGWAVKETPHCDHPGVPLSVPGSSWGWTQALGSCSPHTHTRFLSSSAPAFLWHSLRHPDPWNNLLLVQQLKKITAPAGSCEEEPWTKFSFIPSQFDRGEVWSLWPACICMSY